MALTATGTFAEYMRPLGTHLAPQLVSSAAFETMQSAAHLIPGALAMSLFGFECCLTGEEPVANFQLCADAEYSARQTLAQAIATGNVLLRNHPAWQRIYDFLDAWSYKDSVLDRYIRNILLEFGTASPGREVPVPSVYLGIRKEEEQEVAGAKDLHQLTAVCLKALTLLRGNPVPDTVAAKIVSTISDLPHVATLELIGSLQVRKSQAYRLIIGGLNADTIPEYLQRIGWSGALDELEAMLSATSRFCDYIWLSIDLEEDVCSRVGWECYYNNRIQPHDDSRWTYLLDHLVAHGMCVEAKKEGVLSYPGAISASASGPLWPESLRLLSPILGPHSLDKCTTALHHIKISYQPDLPPIAKAYLSAYYE